MLDLSAAFDTIDHYILLKRLKSGFGIRGTALSWFAFYLSNRSQQILIDGSLSMNFELSCGVPQGSCLGSLLFVLYASKIFQIVDKHLPGIHCYADDSQLYLSFCPNASVNQDIALARMESYIDDFRNWMLNDKLKLNNDKTEFLIIGTSQQLAKVTYADDSQLYLSFCPNASVNQDIALARMECYIDDFRNWMLNDKLKLNEDKTEFLIIGTSQQLANITISSLCVGNSAITPMSCLRGT